MCLAEALLQASFEAPSRISHTLQSQLIEIWWSKGRPMLYRDHVHDVTLFWWVILQLHVCDSPMKPPCGGVRHRFYQGCYYSWLYSYQIRSCSGSDNFGIIQNTYSDKTDDLCPGLVYFWTFLICFGDPKPTWSAWSIFSSLFVAMILFYFIPNISIVAYHM